MNNVPYSPAPFSARPIDRTYPKNIPCDRDHCHRQATWSVTHIGPDTKPHDRFPHVTNLCKKHAAAWILELFIAEHPQQPDPKCETFPRLSSNSSGSSPTET